jgi:hypothetical protein
MINNKNKDKLLLEEWHKLIIIIKTKYNLIKLSSMQSAKIIPNSLKTHNKINKN